MSTFLTPLGPDGAASGGSGSSTLAGDTDVSITTPTNGQVLTYVTADSKWENKAATSGGNVTGPVSSTNNDVAIFSGTGGQTLADGGKTLPSGTIVGTSDSQTLTNKSIAGSQINSGTVPIAQIPTGTTSSTVPLGGVITAGGPIGSSSVVPVITYNAAGQLTAVTTASISGGGGGGITASYITGASMWYPNPLYAGATLSTGTVGVANQYYATPFWLWQNVTVKALGLRVVTTSTGNSSAALQAAIYSDLVTTGNVHRPGTLIDFTASFATGSTASVSAAMNNGTDALTAGLIWIVVQKFDGTATFAAFVNTVTNGFLYTAGTATLASAVGANPLSAVNTAGTGYGGVNWVNFTSSTTWNENVGTLAAPQLALQVN